ncbi:YopX family protein [Bacillus cereus]
MKHQGRGMEMREISFRAWDLGAESMVDWESIKLHFSEHIDHEMVVVMQYTGLKDKNGKEIYEGDILDLSSEDDSVIRCEIVYQAPSFCRKWHHANTIRLRQREIEPMAWNTHLYEVIGNIYENPELLKTK